jgi:hypothetical protein
MNDARLKELGMTWEQWRRREEARERSLTAKTRRMLRHLEVLRERQKVRPRKRWAQTLSDVVNALKRPVETARHRENAPLKELVTISHEYELGNGETVELEVSPVAGERYTARSMLAERVYQRATAAGVPLYPSVNRHSGAHCDLTVIHADLGFQLSPAEWRWVDALVESSADGIGTIQRRGNGQYNLLLA